MIIFANPTSADSKENDFAIKVGRKDNVTIRNVIIYHAANGMGIYGFQANNLKIENVKIYAYGNEEGAQPCPTRKPFGGYDCSNIKLRHCKDV